MEVEASKNGKAIGQNDISHPSSLSRPSDRTPSRRSRIICFGLIVTAVVLAIALLILVLTLTVFKARHPVTTVNSMALKNFDLTLDIARLQVHLNISLDVHLSMKNPNKVGFKYANSTSHLEYRGQVVGEVPLPGGKILAGQSTAMNVTLTLLAERLLSDSRVFSDVISGALPLSTHTRISGKLHILFFRIHAVSYTDCDLTINVPNRAVTNMSCRYKTKL